MIRVPSIQAAPEKCSINGSFTLAGGSLQGYVYPTPDQAYTGLLSY